VRVAPSSATLAGLAIPMYEYSPRKVKQAVCGYGNASKEQVAVLMAQRLQIDVTRLPTMRPMPWPWPCAMRS